MRIKFNDKIYRLKEIESGVDSLMELVEEPKYKDGDFVYEDERIMIVKSYPNMYHANVWYTHSDDISYNETYGVDFSEPTFRYATEEERQILIDAMREDGKRWNAEKKCIEDIHVYNDGDFVVCEFGSILIFREADGDRIFDHAYLPSCGELVINKNASYFGIKRHATTEEKQRMIDALAKLDKCWNADKKCIEYIPRHKFKKGDKVTLKSGCISKPNIEYSSYFNYYIGKELEVVGYDTYGNVLCDNAYYFSEDWLELYVEKQQQKFKAGDKVRIKDGVSSKSHRYVSPNFTEPMDEFIGKELTVGKYNSRGFVVFYEDDYRYQFAEDWLEPWSDEPKVGDWVVAWDVNRKAANVGILEALGGEGEVLKYVVNGFEWMIAVKWDGTIEHLEKVRKGEI